MRRFPFCTASDTHPGVITRPAVLALFTSQHGVASTAQLDLISVSKFAVTRACAAATIERVHLGVYKLAGVELGFLGTALALQLRCGPSAFLSGRTAGAIYGLRGMPHHPVEVSVREYPQPSVPSPHRVVRTTWDREARDVVTRHDGIRVTTPLRTLFDLARCCNQHRFERAAEDMWHKRLVTPDQASDYLDEVRRSGKTGVLRMAQWLDRAAARPRPAQSGLELDVIDMIERAGLPTPARQHPLLLLTGELIHLDIAWPDIRLAIEPGHSWWHGGDLRQRADQARDRACTLVGWHVHRYDEDAALHPSATAQEIRALYRQRATDLGRSV